MPLCWPKSDGSCACPRGHIQKNSGKAPLTTHADKDATTDRAVIEGWWAEWPSANVGVALASSGLVAIDCDSSEALQEASGLGLVPTVCRTRPWPLPSYQGGSLVPQRRLSNPPKINPEWSRGPRIPAWDALWRRILADVIDPEKNVPGDAAGDPRNEN